MELERIVAALEYIAPTCHAEPWDNVGLLSGRPDDEVSRCLLTIDYTPAVAADAQEQRCELVVAYHPPIFEPLKRIAGDSLLARAVRSGVALYSPHTALDVAPGGTNDVLADLLGLVNVEPLKYAEAKPDTCKLVTFVPEAHVERVSEALFGAGAGRIGNYSACSFRSAGTGTFHGDADKTSPTVGQPGRLERVDEMKLEVVLSLRDVVRAVAALRSAHPYEEPAFDLVSLVAPPTGMGMGRIGRLADPCSPDTFIARVKKATGLGHVLIAGPAAHGTIRRVAVCAGSCGKLLEDAIARRADAYVTGEMRHHDALRAADAGLLAICLLHSNSERPALTRLRDRLAEQCPGVVFKVSQKDADPFQIT